VSSEFQRLVKWTPAYNHIAEGYGRHGMEVKFVLIGEQAAIQFVLYTNWMTAADRANEIDEHRGGGYCLHKPQPSDFGYHARHPQYKGQSIQAESCDYLGGAPCYYDGSGMRANKVFDVFTDGGEEALWKALEDEYQARFIVGVPVTVESANFGEVMAAFFGEQEP